MEKGLKNTVKIFLALTLIAPFIFVKNLLFLFITTKVFYFYFIIEIVLIILAVLLYYNKKYFSVNVKNKIVIAFLAYFGIKVFSDLLGISFLKSFWGGYERMMGIFTWIHLLTFFFLLINFYKKRKEFLILFDVSIFVSILVSGYGLLQKIGVRPDLILNSGINRLDATIGNAAFLAAYLIFNIFFALFLFLKKKDINWRAFYLAVIIFESLILFFTATRGGMIGLVVGFGLFFILNLFVTNNKKAKTLSISVLMMFIALSGVFYVARNSSFIQGSEPLRRIANISFEDATVKSRLTLWQKSLIIFKEKPVLGWGENNINVAIDKYYSEDINEEWFDSTHNIVFDNLVGHGILGVVSYLLLFVVVLWSIFKGRVENKEEFLAFSSLFIAYLVQNLFLFDNLVTLLMLLLSLAYITVVFSNKEEVGSSNKGYSIVIALFLITISVVSMSLNYKAVQAAKYVVGSKRYSVVDPQKSIDLYEKSIDTAYYGHDDIGNIGAVWIQDILAERVSFMGEIDNLILLNKKALEKAIERDPLYSKNYLILSKVFQSGRKYDEKYIDQSIELLEKALPLSPERLVIYKGLAQAYFYKEDYIKSKEYLTMSIPFSLSKGEIYYNIAVMNFLGENNNEGDENIKRALVEGYELSENQFIRLVNIFVDKKEFNLAIDYYKKLIDINPQKIEYYASIATVYKELGDIEKAKEYGYKILEIDEGAKDVVDDFISTLE
jgi:O-antigen ligase